MLSVPNSRKSKATLLRRPTSVDDTSTTVTIPMTTPTMASAERAGWERMDWIASVAASPRAPDTAAVRVDADIGLFRSHRRDHVEADGSSRRIPAGQQTTERGRRQAAGYRRRTNRDGNVQHPGEKGDKRDRHDGPECT